MTATRLRLLASAAMSMGLLGLSVQAQAAAMVEAVTVTATRTPTPVSLAPATVSVITANQIDDDLVTDIKDLVRAEPGVAVRRNPYRVSTANGTGRDGNSGFNIRGLEGDRVLIQIDGIRIPNAFSFGPQSTGRGDYAELDLMKSVEILRGPASALYGSDGLAGAVSFTTKDPQDLIRAGKTFGAQAKAGYDSSSDTWSEGVALAGQQGPWSGMIAYTRRDGHEMDNKGTNDSHSTARTTADPQDTQSNAVLAKLIFAPDDHNRLRLTYDHDDQRIATDVLSAIINPPTSGASTIGLKARDTLRRDRVSLDYRYRGDGAISQAEAAIYYQTSEARQFSAEKRNTASSRTRLSTFGDDVLGGSLQLESHLTTGPIGHHFIYGVEASATREAGIRSGTVPSTGDPLPSRAFPITDDTLVGVFAEDEISLFSDRLMLYPAVRYDHYELSPKADALFTSFTPKAQSAGRVTPKVGALFHVTPNVGLFVNYAQGFRAPEPVEVNNAFTNLIFGYTSIPNPNLKPETSETVEGGVRFTGERWSASVTGFGGRYTNFIEQALVGGTFSPGDPGIFQYVNLSHVEISGVEAKGQAVLGMGLSATAGVSYASGTVTESGVKIPLDTIEPLKLAAGLTWREPKGRFGGALDVTHSEGKTKSAAAGSCGQDNFGANLACFTPPGFTTVDLTAFWNINEHVTARVGLFNLTDQKYWWWSDVRGLADSSNVKDAYSQPGRNVSASLSVRF